MTPEIDKLCIDTVRVLAMDAVQTANSGHPGTPMALAPAAYTLWAKFMKHNPADPAWPDRDRFVLSCGHASMLLYALLHLSGYDLPLEEIKAFRQWGSKTPGHPEVGHTAGVETTTGPLGQGLGNACGMAIAERFLASRFNKDGFEVVNHRTFAFASDGDLMEGVGMESVAMAGHLGLEKLIVLWDDNKITIEGSTDLAFTEEVDRRFQAHGWRVLKVENGEDLWALGEVFEEAMKPCGKPTLIDCRTIIGFPSPAKQGTAKAHGEPLGADEIRVVKGILGWDPDSQFHIPAAALEEWRKSLGRGEAAQADWRGRFEAYRKAHPDLAAQFEAWMRGELPAGWEAALPVFTAADKMATREASGKTLNALAPKLGNLLGGSADLAGSNNTTLKGEGDFSATETGRNFHFGVREHGMGAVLNGMSLHGGLRPYGATFLQFADYMRASIRLASLMKQPVTYVFTHDSIGLGEDGPTHQPVEHLMALRLIPGLSVIRPADAAETAEAWRAALTRKDGPTALILTRQKLPTVTEGKAAGLAKGAYVLAEASAEARLVLIATGSEVSLALKVREALEGEGIPTRVVSMPAWDRFEAQSAAYRASVLPATAKKLSIEAGSTFGWQRHADDAVGLDHFGASAPAEILFEQFGFTVPNVVAKAKALLG
ncbi:MAG TPA: transketolase [Holophagaceae bacterium]|nr:transketolase [Holophagaceae bacterium]